MNETTITLETPVVESPRVLQVRGIFDLQAQRTCRQQWRVHLPLDERPWNIGLIVGPSGCGKSTIARHLFADALRRQEALDDWPANRSILDAFPAGMPIQEVVSLLSSVGFSSPPAWLLPLMIPIELISQLARPISLAVRLFANMTAGHVILGVLFGLAVSGGLLIGWLPFAFTIAMNGLEVGIAFIQAYIFTVLTCVYLGDAFHLHGHDEHAH